MLQPPGFFAENAGIPRLPVDKKGMKLYITRTLRFIPRLCNGSTSDSGSDCGGSNPPWGIKAERICSAFFMAPSNIGLVHRPLKAERRVRLP